MHSLERIADWPVDHAAAAVITPRGVAETYGDGARVFPLASVTKPLVAYAALVAIEEGTVGLAMPAGPPGSTVRHLLAHASGLDFGQRIARAPVGSRRMYSSAGFEVLADLIAAEAGMPFAEYLSGAVFEPLGMTNTALVGSAGHGATSTVDDLACFAAELLSPTLIDPATHAEAVTVQFPGLRGVLPGYGMQDPNDWGLGFEIRNHKSPHWTAGTNSPATYGHFGQSGTFLWVDPRADVACVVLTDRDFGDWAKPLWPELSGSVLAGRPGR